VVDKDALIHRNAVSDRTYLSSPFRDILPSVRMPAKYVHPSGASAQYPANANSTNAPVSYAGYGMSVSAQVATPYVPSSQEQTYSTASVKKGSAKSRSRSKSKSQAPLQQETESAKIQMAITVPAGRRPGESIQFLSPSGKVNQVQIPANMMPGMQFLVNAEA
jgi:hypothetical protein